MKILLLPAGRYTLAEHLRWVPLGVNGRIAEYDTDTYTDSDTDNHNNLSEFSEVPVSRAVKQGQEAKSHGTSLSLIRYLRNVRYFGFSGVHLIVVTLKDVIPGNPNYICFRILDLFLVLHHWIIFSVSLRLIYILW